MEEVQEKTILMVTLGVLALAFFSYSVNPGTGAAVYTSKENFDCSDLRYGREFMEEEITSLGSQHVTSYKPHYDLDKDGKITQKDLNLIRELMDTHNCRDIENECAEIGRTRCDNLGKIGTCVKDNTGRMIWNFVQCPKGMECKYKTASGYRNIPQSSAKPSAALKYAVNFAQCEYRV